MLKNTATLFFAMLPLALAGCQSSNSAPRIQTIVQIVAGHTHALDVRYRDVQDGREVYVLDESSGHHHEIRLNPEQRGLLLLRAPVTVTSSPAANHSHVVSLSVADE